MLRKALLGVCGLVVAGCAQMPAATSPAVETASLQERAAMKGEIDALKHLTAIGIDASTLYQEAAEEADNPELAAELKTLAAERESFAKTLQTRVALLGAEPEENGEIVGAFHRAFAHIRGQVQNDSLTAAAEVYRGESYLVDEIRAAQAKVSTPASRDLLEMQLGKVLAGRDRVEAFKDQLAARQEAEKLVRAQLEERNRLARLAAERERFNSDYDVRLQRRAQSEAELEGG